MPKTWLFAASLLLLATGLKAQIPGSCNFVRYDNTNIYGGVINPATSESSCQDACRTRQGCQGIDWSTTNSAGQQCFIHNKTTDKNSNVIGVTHYDYICNGTGPSMPTPPPPTTGCKACIEVYPDTSSVGGYNVPEIRDVLGCNAACKKITPCLGFDFSQSTGCWFHYSSSSFSQKFYQQGVTQFKFNRCPEEGISSCTASYNNGVLTSACNTACYPKWMRLDNTAGSGGTVVTTVGQKNFSACLEYCFDSSDCVGVDYSDAPGNASVCAYYPSSQTSAMNNVMTKAYVTQYRLMNKCWLYCTTNYEQNDNYRYRLFSTASYPIASQTDCERQCRMSQTCQAYQFTKSGPASPSCSLADDYYIGSGIMDSTVYTGLLKENCNRMTLPTTPGVQGSSQTPPQSVQRECQASTDVYPDTSSIGGYNVPEIRDVLGCNAACKKITPCLGFDFSQSTGCWFHYDPTSFSQKYYQQGITQFKFNRCPEEGISSCTPGTTSGGVTSTCVSTCYPKWMRLDNTVGSGGTLVTTVGQKNFSACLEYCFDSSDCVGVDYSDAPGNSSACSYYPSSQSSALYNVMTKLYSTQYRLVNRCMPNCTTYFEQNDNYRYRLFQSASYPIASQADCERQCSASQTCEAYQFTKSGPASPSCSLADAYYVGSGVMDSTVYTGLFKENCNRTVFPATPGVSVSSGSGSCNFVRYDNTNIYGGMINPATSESSCQDACRATQGCQGIDWSTTNSAGQQCFLLTKTTDKNSNIIGVTHYDYICNGTTSQTTIVPSACWQRYPSTLIYGGRQNSATSLNDCYNACLALGKPTCVSIDWSLTNPPGSQCFLLNTQLGKTMNQPGVDHYDLTC